MFCCTCAPQIGLAGTLAEASLGLRGVMRGKKVVRTTIGNAKATARRIESTASSAHSGRPAVVPNFA
jgi:hypothetical protein